FGVKFFEKPRRGKLHLFHRNEACPDSLFRQVEKRLLRTIENLVRRIGLIKTLGHDFVRGVDQLPERRSFADDLDVVLDIDEMWNAVEQSREVADAACALEL